MKALPHGIEPVWEEDVEREEHTEREKRAYALCFMESPSEGDWVPDAVPLGEKRPDRVYAGRVRFYHHERNPKLRAQSFSIFSEPEPFLWRFWDDASPEFEWMVRFGGEWWWLPLRESRIDMDSPHSIRFQVMGEMEARAGLPRRARKVMMIVTNNHGRLLFREVFTNPGLA